MKCIIRFGVGMILCSGALGAHAGVITTFNIASDIPNSNNQLGKYSGTVSYDSDFNNDGTTGRLTITLNNDTDSMPDQGTITGFGFNVAISATVGAGNLSLFSTTHPDFGAGSGALLFGPSNATKADGWGKFEVAVVTGPNLNLNGGTVADGIAAGDTGTFEFDIDITDLGFESLTAMDFLSEDSTDPGGRGGTPFIVRFQGFDTGEGSDFSPLLIVPLPPAVIWGFAGLLCVAVFTRISWLR